MIRYLNHLAIAVPDLEAAITQYRDVFGLVVTEPQELPTHGVRIAVVEMTNVKIELMEPLDGSSPIINFLKKHPNGGLHHISFEVDDSLYAKDKLADAGLMPLGDGKATPGFHGTPTLFYSPKDCNGVLVEFEEKSKVSQEPIAPVRTNVSRALSKQKKKVEYPQPGANVKVFMDDWY